LNFNILIFSIIKYSNHLYKIFLFKMNIFKSRLTFISWIDRGWSKKLSSRWWSNDKSLRPRGLFSLWSQIRALWLLIWWPLEAYMVVNFRARGISRGTRKLVRIPTLNYKKKKILSSLFNNSLSLYFLSQVLKTQTQGKKVKCKYI